MGSRRLFLAVLMTASGLEVACLDPDQAPAPSPGEAQLAPGFRQLEPWSVEVEGQAVLVRTRPLGEEWLDIEVQLHGMALCATVDAGGQLAELDGFSLQYGQDTWITEPDRQVLRALVEHLEYDSQFEGLDTSVRRVVSHWSQTPEPAPLQRAVYGSARSSLCSSFGQYELAWHDDLGQCTGSDQLPAVCASRVELGARYPATHYSTGGPWTTRVPDHQAGLFETGDCFGNCGYGCPRGAQTLTRDCLNHDHCVRNGHSLISPACLDEFFAAADDELFAPTCPGT